MNGLGARALAAWIVVLATGCGDGGGRDVPIEEYGELSTGALCDALLDCYGPAVVAQLGGEDCAGSLHRLWEQQQGPRLQQAIAEGTIVYDGTRVEACLAEVAAAGCGAVDRVSLPECEAVLVGNVAPGGACSIEEQCEGESFCRRDTMCPGTCQARVASGSACTESAACQPGLRCAAGTCQAAAGVGASCEGSTGLPCAGGLICFGGTDASPGMPAAPGTCQTRESLFTANVGDLCDPEGDGPLCVEDARCALTGVSGGTTAVWECEAPVASGAACHLAFPEECPTGEICLGVLPLMGDFDGTCGPRPGSGEPCERNLCADGTRCVSSTCQPVSDVGGACTTGFDCFSGTCEDGVCAEAMLCAG